MEMSRLASIADLVRGMVEQPRRHARRLKALREAIVAGTYRISAAKLADALLRSMRR